MTRTITPTHVLLSQVTLAASASSMTFSNIPQTFGDLVLVATNLRSPGGGVSVGLVINSDSGANYPYVRMIALGAGIFAQSFSVTGSMTDAAGTLDTTEISMTKIEILDYSATDKHKTGLSRWTQWGGSVTANAFRWASTNGITSVQLRTIDPNSGNASGSFATGSTFSLYGVFA